MKTLTSYDDINSVLEQLSLGLKKILDGQLVGLYLTGSLSYGDFNYGSSDIDFLAVLNKKLSKDQLDYIKDMHAQIGNNIPYWAKRLEGSYITQEFLKRKQTPTEARPYVNAGKVNVFPFGNEWIINLNTLHDYSVAIIGPDPKIIFPKVTSGELKEASIKDLVDEWLPKISDPNAFNNPDYESAHLKVYAVLTMCRILHRCKNNSFATKKSASDWVKKNYSQWKNLVEKAENWQHGKGYVSDEKVKDFIQFTCSEVGV
jgi:hypothetical protein